MYLTRPSFKNINHRTSLGRPFKKDSCTFRDLGKRHRRFLKFNVPPKPLHLETISNGVRDYSTQMTASKESNLADLVHNRQKHVLLIDGTPLIYRAYYGIPALSSSPVNAVYGFLRTILKLLRDFKYDYLAICLDGKESFRKAMEPTYKATRKPLEVSLINQFPIVSEAIRTFGIASPQISGYEADDILATYARIASEEGHRVTIYTPDKDLLQTLGPNISVMTSNSTRPVDVEEFQRRYSILPHQLPHLQAIIGDKVDNIPKIYGITEKLARELITQFETVQNLLDNLDQVENAKARKVLAEHRETILKSYNLAKLHTHLEVPPLETLTPKGFDKTNILEFLRKYKFKSLETYMFAHYWNNEKTSYVLDYENILAFSRSEEFKNTIQSNPTPRPPKSDPVSVETVLKRVREKNPHYMQFKIPEEGELMDEVVEDLRDFDNDKGSKNVIKLITSRVVEVDPEFVNAIALASNTKELREAIEEQIPGITVVNDEESANRVLQKLMSLTDVYHACDTECVGLNIKTEGPVGHGKIICFSIYCGPDIDFGNGSRIWVDNLGDSEGTIMYFKEYFEREDIKKVWHNYSFDRHMLFNHGIDCRGFGGDTMHMGRLWNVSLGMRSYSLASLSSMLLHESSAKKSMKARFGRLKVKKDGTLSKSTIILPELDALQRDPEWLKEWIDYSTLDTESTWHLREELEKLLKKMEWTDGDDMMDFYNELWLPFGELLTDMERRGIKVDVPYLQSVIPMAEEERNMHEKNFIDWAVKYISPECKFMNPGSDAQKQQILFAPCRNALDPSKMLDKERVFECENIYGFIEEGRKAPKKKMKFTLPGLGLPFVDTTEAGWPSVSQDVLAKLAGNPPTVYGPLVKLFEEKGIPGGKEACDAIASSISASKIDTLISNFMRPLSEMADEQGRIHGSININTETGRLSSRRPNLQNQPSVEKDRFKIRKAFVAEPGKSLIVADYGQLELRLLAHITNCKSMIEAFAQGGDFHSRTAMGMYPEVQKAINRGEVLLEWDYSKGQPPLPLLKDAFAVERRRAKTLNFSIAYGKTVKGLAKDWNVTTAEAKKTLDRWYSDRPEVLEWQQKTIAKAHKVGYTRTLLGRYRHLPDINSRDMTKRGHSERAAINTPLQGGAADITTKAMINIYRNPRLRELGWFQLLQIHDELILEGPDESVDEAMDILVQLMCNPLPTPLKVELVVDAKKAKSWYEGK